MFYSANGLYINDMDNTMLEYLKKINKLLRLLAVFFVCLTIYKFISKVNPNPISTELANGVFDSNKQINK